MDSTDDAGPKLTGEERSAFPTPAEELAGGRPRVTLGPDVPLRFHGQDDIDRREALRAAELSRMDDLYTRIEQGMDDGYVDLESGVKMLLNVSAARAALGGVGHVGGWAF